MNGELFETFQISIKATHQEALTFICFTVLIFLNILAFQCWSFCWIFENSCPGGRVLARFFCPGVGVSHFLCARGVGNSPFQKDSPGVCLGGDGKAWN